VISSHKHPSKNSQRLHVWKDYLRIYLRIVALLRSHWLWTLGAVACLGLATGFALVVPWLLGLVINAGLQHGQFGTLLLITLAILIASILRGLSAYGQGYLNQGLAALVAYDLRNTLYDHVQTLDFSFHDEAETGQLMSRLTVDIDAVSNFVPMGILRALLAVIYFTTITIILFTYDWQLALITMISIPIIIFLAAQVGSRLRPLWKRIQDETGELGTVMQESLSGVRVVKAFVREEFEMNKYDTKNYDLRTVNMDAMRLSAWNQPLMILSINIITVLVIWVGGMAVINHRIDLGALVAVTQYVLLLTTPVRSLGFVVTWFMRGFAGGTNIFGVLDTQPSITDAPGALDMQEMRGDVRFENVSFAYGNGREVLHNIEIAAKPGQVVAILGATGSGKSTILHLLPRFYDTTKGHVLVDGHDVRDLTLHSLRRNIGLVLQDVFLFNATLRDNIAFGVENATEEAIIAAAKAARVHDFVSNLPDGYETWVGERGVTLSGGQKQRVAIARTLLLNPQILILDDSTSSVDMETEYLIQQALDTVMQGRTSFVVASRLRTIKNADQILVLENGSIVEHGTHAELLKNDGPYTRLYDLQLREQEEFEERQRAVSPLDEDAQPVQSEDRDMRQPVSSPGKKREARS